MKKLFAAMLIALSFTASAEVKESDLWVELASSVKNDMSYSALKGSGAFTKNDDGIFVYAVTGRTVDKVGAITPFMWYVVLKECLAGKGDLVTMDPQGNFLFATPYAFGMGTVAAIMAKTLCNVAEQNLDQLPQSTPKVKKKQGTV